jgi:hypothetical protein
MKTFRYFILLTTTSLLLAVPKTPTSLTFTDVSKDSITLNWKDNSDSESGFKIYRDGVFIALLNPNTKSFRDKNLKPDTTYNYTIKSTTDEFTKVSDYNVKCDGSNESSKIQSALDDYKNWRGGMLLFPRDKTCVANSLQWGYKINGDSGKIKGYIDGREDRHYVIFGNGSTIKALDGAVVGDQNDKSYILWIINGEYIDIISLNFDGNRATRGRSRDDIVAWSKRNEEKIYQYYYNSNLVLSNLSHILVENVKTVNSIEDGIYVGWIKPKYYSDIGNYPMDYKFKNVNATNAFRNNLTISNCIGCLVDGGEFSSARGVSPEAGIDIECDSLPEDKECIKDVKIISTIMQDNAGPAISVSHAGKPTNIEITRNIFKNCRLRESEGCNSNGLAITAGGMSGNSSITRNRFLNFKSRGGSYRYIGEDSVCRSLIDFGSSGSDLFGKVDVSVNYFQNILGLKDDGKKIIYIHSDNGGKNKIRYNRFKNVGYTISDDSREWYHDGHEGNDKKRSSFIDNKYL